MKLEIDLADREEVAAAVPLLQLILDNTPTVCSGKTEALASMAAVTPRTELIPQVSTSVAPSLHAEFKAAQAADTREPITTLADPAAVFGAGLPLPGPSAQDLGRPLTAAEAPAATFGAANVPPPPVAPAAPVAAGSVELDSKGLPWDARIHAGSKAKVKDGTWRMKKELDLALLAQVEAELRAALGNAPTAAPIAAPTPPAPPVGAASPTTSALPPAAPVASAPGGDPATFEQIMLRVTAAVTSGLMPPTALGAACNSQGLGSIVALQQNPAMVPLVWAVLKQQIPSL